ncbi:MAG: hypothetical protein AAGN35_11060 [Bacteroidota bacterium]
MKNISASVLFCFLFSLFAAGCNNEDDPTPSFNDPDRVAFYSGAEVADGQGNRYLVGFDQVSSNNQNPYVQKRDAEGNELWRYSYETSGVDGRGVIAAVDASDQPWVVFSLDGGSNGTDYITRLRTDADAFNGVFQNTYGNGGGPTVAVIARLDPESGEIMRASFLTARLTDGATNTLRITKIGFNEGLVVVSSESAAWPPGLGLMYERLPNITDADRVDGVFKIDYAFDEALKEIRNAVLLRE